MNLTLDVQQLLSLLVGAVGAGVVWGLMKGSVKRLQTEVVALRRWKADQEEENKLRASQDDIQDLQRQVDRNLLSIQGRVTHTEIQETGKRIDRVDGLVAECNSNLTMLRAVCVGASGRNGLYGEHRELRVRFEQMVESRPWHNALTKYASERLDAEANIYEKQEKLDTRLREVERLLSKVVIK